MLLGCADLVIELHASRAALQRSFAAIGRLGSKPPFRVRAGNVRFASDGHRIAALR
jgi:hypothetical protein